MVMQLRNYLNVQICKLTFQARRIKSNKKRRKKKKKQKYTNKEKSRNHERIGAKKAHSSKNALKVVVIPVKRF